MTKHPDGPDSPAARAEEAATPNRVAPGDVSELDAAWSRHVDGMAADLADMSRDLHKTRLLLDLERSRRYRAEAELHHARVFCDHYKSFSEVCMDIIREHCNPADDNCDPFERMRRADGGAA